MTHYYATRSRDGTSDEILIRRPNGEGLAVVTYWDEPDTNEADRAERIARHLVDALNAYRKPLRLPRLRINPPATDTDVPGPPWE